MKRFKKIVRLVTLVLMVFLASIGIAFGLVVPIAQNRRREDPMAIIVEPEESDKQKPENIQFNDQQE